MVVLSVPPDVHTISELAVIGAGDMGHGFAVQFATHEIDVTLIDHRQSNLDEAAQRIEDVVRFLNEEGITSMQPDQVRSRISMTLDQSAGVADADMVLETVPEDLAVKQEVIVDVAAAAPSHAILASNTSGIPITDIAEAIPDAADRLVGCHWWYPPYLLPTVEVVRGELTGDATIDRVRDVLERVDRIPITVERDVPGFVWNRIQMAIFREALHLAETGVASLEDINRAIRDGYAIRTAAIGPIETIDIAGLELVQTVAGDLNPHLCNDTDANSLFETYLERGRGGIEDGAGFFEYNRTPEEIVGERDATIAAIRRVLDSPAGLDDG